MLSSSRVVDNGSVAAVEVSAVAFFIFLRKRMLRKDDNGLRLKLKTAMISVAVDGECITMVVNKARVAWINVFLL
jgi:hypothetical protein